MSNKEQQIENDTPLENEAISNAAVEEVQKVAEEFTKSEETSGEELSDKEVVPHKKIMWIASGIIGGLCLIYLGISFFFVNHFYYKTVINGVDFSAKTITDVENYMQSQVDGYALTLKERGNAIEEIRGTDIDLVYKGIKGAEELLHEQNAFLWITALFGQGNNDTVATVEVEYNQDKLDQVINALTCMQEENQKVPVSAQPVYNGGQFEIQKEEQGTQLHVEQFQNLVADYVKQLKNELDLEEQSCYISPKFTEDASEVLSAKERMNQYLTASITYNIGSSAETVDKTLISQWLKVDEDMNVIFSTESVEAFVEELSSKYNTVGKVRTIQTPTGKTAEVSGGGYGWKIDKEREYEALVENIKAGEKVTREPEYAQRAASHEAADWGTTYLEVDLTTQHMWYIVNGTVALETDVVTGVPVPERITPQGTYEILEMVRNKTLKGDRLPNGELEYETPVAYWMRVTWTGIGFHDANWQRKFGGELYKQGKGSHGCINMPVDKAGELYQMLEVGCPVIIHY